MRILSCFSVSLRTSNGVAGHFRGELSVDANKWWHLEMTHGKTDSERAGHFCSDFVFQCAVRHLGGRKDTN